MKKMRILLIEDDPQIGSGVRDGLRLEGLLVDWVRDGMAGWHELDRVAQGDSEHYQACVIDLGLPRLDGESLVQKIRQRADALKSLPILVLTAQDDIGRSVRCLDNGADDYVIKPVAHNLLAARLRALVRRMGRSVESILRVGPLDLDLRRRQVWIHEQKIDLLTKEFMLLQALMMADGRILTRENLSRHLYEWGQEIQSNAIEVHIHHIRKKLGKYGSCLETVRGLGYRVRQVAEHG